MKSSRIIVEPLDARPPGASAIRAFASDPFAQYPAVLESSRFGGPYGRYTTLATNPAATVRMEMVPGRCPWRSVGQAFSEIAPPAEAPPDFPFGGGWIGYAAYEAGLSCEGIEPHRVAGPLPGFGRFAFYDHAAVLDHFEDRWYAVAVEWPGQRTPASARLAALRTKLCRAHERSPEDPPVPFTTTPTPNMSQSAYLRKVARTKQYIEDGDIYQANLTQQFTARTTAEPLDLYLRLRTASPSWYGALLQYDDGAVLSSSPELFLELRDGRVLTRPIKGTRPRTGRPHEDAVHRRDLARSEKDRAELTMIVDLLRNDLGRVCAFGSVRVPEAAAIEEHPQVFHQVATIEGRLDSGRTWVDLLRASFPGGSVTGAPKIRAMQIIRELEPTPRGVYCGAIGWIGLHGDATFNIAIRTMVHRAGVVHLHAGGAIVADSDPHAEYEECIAKLGGMLAALNAEAPAAFREVSQPVIAA